MPRDRTAEDKQNAKEKAELDRKLTEYTGDLASYTEALFIVTLLLALLAGGLAAAAFWQIREGRKGIQATEKAAKAAMKHVTVAEDTAKRQLRAYVSDQPTGIKIFAEADDGIAIRVQFTFINENHGQTPARNVRHFCLPGIYDHPLPDDFVIPEINEDVVIVSATIIFPGMKFPANSSEFPVTVTKLEPIFEGVSRRLYIFGITRYDDIFGNPHETGLCVHCGGTEFRDIFNKVRREAQISHEAIGPLIFDHSNKYNYER